MICSFWNENLNHLLEIKKNYCANKAFYLSIVVYFLERIKKMIDFFESE